MGIFKRLIYISFFILASFIIELSFFLYSGMGFLPVYLLYDLAGVCLFSGIIMLIGNKKAFLIVGTIILSLQAIIAFANVNLIEITGDVFSWDMLSVVHEGAVAAKKGIVLYFQYLFIIVPIIVMFVVSCNIIFKKDIKEKVVNHRGLIIMEIACSFFLFSGFVFAFQNGKIEKKAMGQTNTVVSDNYLRETFYIKQEALRKFGTFGFYLPSGYSLLERAVRSKEEQKDIKDELSEYFSTNSNYDNGNSFTRVAYENNLIFILFETWDYMGINKYLTPNMYELIQKSLFLANYHSKDQTNISEAKTLFGLYPLTGILNYNYLENAYPFTLPNMFRSANPGAQVVSFHNNTGEYYDRQQAHVHYGFDIHVDKETMKVSENEIWINLDSEMFSSVLSSQTGCTSKLFIPSDTSTPFYSYMTTFTTHGPFLYREELEPYYEIIDEYIAETGGVYETISGYTIDLTDEETKEQYSTYLATVMDVDKGIGMLVAELEERNLMDDTTIVIMADHFAYYQDLAFINKDFAIDDTDNPEVYHVPGFIYNKELVSELKGNSELRRSNDIEIRNYDGDEILCANKFFTNIDIVPTLLNLLGIRYDKAIYLGNDLFSSEETVVLSKWGGIFNDIFYSLDGFEITNLSEEYLTYEKTNTLINGYTEAEYLLDRIEIAEFRERASHYLEKLRYVDLIFESDYFGEGEE